MFEILVTFFAVIILTFISTSISSKKQEELFGLMIIGIKNDIDVIAKKNGYKDANQFWELDKSLIDKAINIVHLRIGELG